MSLARLILASLFCVVAFGSHQMHMRLQQVLPLEDPVNTQVRLMPPDFLRFITLGHSNLMADMLWLQLIQYYGATAQEKSSREYLYPYIDTITSLSPGFEDAYIFGSYVLSDTPQQVEQSLQLLEKGMKQLPDSWLIPFQAGFVSYLHQKDYAKAADYFAQAAQRPEAPRLAQQMAAQLNRRTNDYERCQVGFRLWQDAYEKAPEGELRAKAEKRLVETRFHCDLILLEALIKQYHRDALLKWEASVEAAQKSEATKLPPRPASLYPASLAELVKAGMVSSLPKDPLQRNFVYNAKTGKLQVQPLPWRAYELELLGYVVGREPKTKSTN